MQNMNELLNTEPYLKDIKEYLSVPISHLELIINYSRHVYNDESQKECIVDILNQAIYIQHELIPQIIQNYINLYNNNNNNKEKMNQLNDELIISLKNICKEIKLIEEDLISDYPEFIISDKNWIENLCLYDDDEIKNEPLMYDNSINEYHKITKFLKRKKIKDLFLGLLVIVPIFLWLFSDSLIDYNKNNESNSDLKKIEIDRTYKTIFYIYSAIQNEKNNDTNFYFLNKNSSLKMFDGFTVIDKYNMVDYYFKQYYKLDNFSENEQNLNSITVTNLSYFQCKYILTKLSSISLYGININDKKTENSKESNQYCINQQEHINKIQIIMKK